ncbi:MipA/OmpV family protein [Massilia cavernae]|uniref:MipA/OmpV family protein n=1 Tax=Massilia cavernae TaxID=2320864 RepID=A0A418XGT6_9BURK|nr:MipA/OmpV family protein [Massilia cavernae]RJG11661.1 MipA/OmpV family protein [Massilia cavernae]
MRPVNFYLTHALAAGALLSSCAAALAQTPKPLWELGVVGGGVSTPAYPGSADRSSRGLVLPYLVYRGKIFRSDESGIGARLFRSDVAEFDVGFAASLPARSDDVEARRGMPSLGTLVEFGPRLKWTLSRPTQGSRVRADLPLRTVIEGRGGLRNRGWTFAPRVIYEADDLGNGWSGSAHVGLVAANDKLNDYFYGVRPEFAAAARPAYDAKAGLVLARAGGSLERQINPGLRMFGYLWYENYALSANDASPLLKKDSGVSGGIGFIWTFARSARSAND